MAIFHFAIKQVHDLVADDCRSLSFSLQPRFFLLPSSFRSTLPSPSYDKRRQPKKPYIEFLHYHYITSLSLPLLFFADSKVKIHQLSIEIYCFLPIKDDLLIFLPFLTVLLTFIQKVFNDFKIHCFLPIKDDLLLYTISDSFTHI